jgi:CRISPR/Cas system CSM-associated protein Csm5 (group 7 of RAMP superfamily)
MGGTFNNLFGNFEFKDDILDYHVNQDFVIFRDNELLCDNNYEAQPKFLAATPIHNDTPQSQARSDVKHSTYTCP